MEALLSETQTAIEPVLIDAKGLQRLGITLSNPYLLRLESEGKFPRRLSLGARNVCWVLAEVREFIASRASDEARAATMASNRAFVRAGLAARHVSPGRNAA
jgi:predicted DNA-binding transcriptional regulator AlpA